MKRRSVIAGMGALGLASGLAACGAGRPVLRTSLELHRWEEERGARMGVFARRGFDTVEWRSGERFTYCSTFKLFLAAATLERVQRGEERLDRIVPVTQDDLVPYAPTTGPAVGSGLTVEALCQGMVELSDNPAANILIREMGGLDAWRAWHQSALGDTVTRVDRFEPELNLIDGERDTTTPVQAIANLQALLGDDQRRLSPEHKGLLERWLLDSPTGPGRIKAGAPEGWAVGHKTGTSDRMVNDIGVIRPPEGEPIFIAVYYEGPEGDGPEWAEPAVADAALQAVQAFRRD